MVQYLDGFSDAGAGVAHDNQQIDVGMLVLRAGRTGAEQNNALRFELCCNAIA